MVCGAWHRQSYMQMEKRQLQPTEQAAENVKPVVVANLQQLRRVTYEYLLILDRDAAVSHQHVLKLGCAHIRVQACTGGQNDVYRCVAWATTKCEPF